MAATRRGTLAQVTRPAPAAHKNVWRNEVRVAIARDSSVGMSRAVKVTKILGISCRMQRGVAIHALGEEPGPNIANIIITIFMIFFVGAVEQATVYCFSSKRNTGEGC